MMLFSIVPAMLSRITTTENPRVVELFALFVLHKKSYIQSDGKRSVTLSTLASRCFIGVDVEDLFFNSGETTMGIEEIKSALKALSLSERRAIALFILELEKEHVKTTIGPQIAQDLDEVSKVVQDAILKLKAYVNKK
jgi:hypothetical protein